MKTKLLVVIIPLFILFNSCEKKFEKDDYIGDKDYIFYNQDSAAVKFPSVYKGKNFMLGFIFTNCPDICPITTRKFQLIQEQLKNDGVKNFEFVLISFDPDRDKPSVLKQFAELREIDEKNFKFYYANKKDVQNLMKKLSYVAIPGDTTKTEDGDLIYFFTHSDKMFFVDENLRVKNAYFGSKTDVNVFVKDIEAL